MNMTITLEIIHKEILRVKSELHWVRTMLEDEGELTGAILRDLAKARKEMAQGEYVAHEKILARYG